MTLKQTRILKGISAIEVAKACGVSKQFYCNVETHGLCATNEETARKICDYFGIDLFSYIGVENLKFKPRNKKEWKSMFANLKKEVQAE